MNGSNLFAAQFLFSFSMKNVCTEIDIIGSKTGAKRVFSSLIALGVRHHT